MTDAAALIAWFDANARDMPWRRTRDPYAVLVCEVMSQQTRIETVLDYWTRWMRDFPDVAALADASQDDVLKRWAGLGYYRRARNLHACAQLVAREYAGVLPTTYDELRQLPGVGPYTAAAIASIVHGERVLAVDGNVARVASRYGGVFGDPTRAPFRRAVQQVGESLLDDAQPGASNEAMMELGATVCTPRNPACGECPIAARCFAHTLDDPTVLPQPKPRKAPAEQTRSCAVVLCNDAVWMRRGQQELLGGLLEVPTLDELQHLNATWEHCGVVPHIFSHIRMRYDVFATERAARELPDPSGGEWIPLNSLAEQPISTAMLNVVNAACAHYR